MDFLQYFLSVSKISLIAFFFVFGLLIYEIRAYFLKQRKKAKPTIPQYNEAASPVMPPPVQPVVEVPKVVKPRSKMPPALLFLPVGLAVAVVVVTTFLLSYNANNTSNANNTHAQTFPSPSISTTPAATISATINPLIASQSSLFISPTDMPPVSPSQVVTTQVVNQLPTAPPSTTPVAIAQNPSATPTVIADTPTNTPTVAATLTATPTKKITSLPQTGIVSTLLIISIVAGSLIFFSFIY